MVGDLSGVFDFVKKIKGGANSLNPTNQAQSQQQATNSLTEKTFESSPISGVLSFFGNKKNAGVQNKPQISNMINAINSYRKQSPVRVPFPAGTPARPQPELSMEGILSSLTSAATSNIDNGSASSGKVLSSPGSGFSLTSRYGTRKDPISGVTKKHTGVDYGAPMGTPIQSRTSGTVVYAKPDGAFGNAVLVKDSKGFYHLYGHMSTMLVKPGMKVNAGTILGKVGKTGRATGPHLHYEIRKTPKYGSDIDPFTYS